MSDALFVVLNCVKCMFEYSTKFSVYDIQLDYTHIINYKYNNLGIDFY